MLLIIYFFPYKETSNHPTKCHTSDHNSHTHHVFQYFPTRNNRSQASNSDGLLLPNASIQITTKTSRLGCHISQLTIVSYIAVFHHLSSIHPSIHHLLKLSFLATTMGATAAAALMLPPSKLDQFSPACRSFRRRISTRNRSVVPVARLFGPAIFEASKLKVVFLGVDGDKHPGSLPRAYTLTHSDFTSIITLAISNTINSAQFQGWYNKLQRDEVVAEWRKVKGKMSLHVHCHISGGHFLLNLVARLRYFIFSKELPVVLKAFAHGDGNLFENYPDLEKAMVWVYFHSNMAEFNKVECWGELRDAATAGKNHCLVTEEEEEEELKAPKSCKEECECCFPPYSLIPWSHELEKCEQGHGSSQQLQ